MRKTLGNCRKNHSCNIDDACLLYNCCRFDGNYRALFCKSFQKQSTLYRCSNYRMCRKLLVFRLRSRKYYTLFRTAAAGSLSCLHIPHFYESYRPFYSKQIFLYRWNSRNIDSKHIGCNFFKRHSYRQGLS